MADPDVVIDLADALSMQDGVETESPNDISLGDSLANWADAIDITLDSSVYTDLTDKMTLNDEVRIEMGNTIDLADSMSMDDAIQIIYPEVLSLADAMTMNDAISVQLEPAVIVDLADDLNNWSDAVTTQFSDSNNDYYRNYLNDV